jgi:hypothetical protein
MDVYVCTVYAPCVYIYGCILYIHRVCIYIYIWFWPTLRTRLQAVSEAFGAAVARRAPPCSLSAAQSHRMMCWGQWPCSRQRMLHDTTSTERLARTHTHTYTRLARRSAYKHRIHGPPRKGFAVLTQKTVVLYALRTVWPTTLAKRVTAYTCNGPVALLACMSYPTHCSPTFVPIPNHSRRQSHSLYLQWACGLVGLRELPHPLLTNLHSHRQPLSQTESQPIPAMGLVC